jgi:predicted DNA-binding protein
MFYITGKALVDTTSIFTFLPIPEVTMLTIKIDDELETKLRALIEREHTTPDLFIQKLINQYSAKAEQEDFFLARVYGKTMK